MTSGEKRRILFCIPIPKDEPMSAARKDRTSSPTIELYEKLVATSLEVERKGDKNPYTSLNGNMFTILHLSQVLAIRLPEDKREAFIKKYQTKIFEACGSR